MDFLGKEQKQTGHKPQKASIEMYVPKEEIAQKKKREKIKAIQSEPVPQIVEDKNLDLSKGIKRKRMIKKIIFWCFGIIVFLALVAIISYYLTSKVPQKVESPDNAVKPPIVSNVIPDIVKPKPITNSNEPLPNTPLQPIYGSLIKFAGNSDIYLVEENGELRTVVQNDVRFDNGQTLSEINPNLIYLLPDKWKNVRRGQREVQGQVDFDPRVLTLPELLPFL